MNKQLCGNAVVGQSGGPTCAINATLAGVMREAKQHPGRIPVLYGMRNGIEGLMREALVRLTGRYDAQEQLALLEQTPAAFLGSCRKKLPDPVEDAGFYERLLAVFRKYDIRYFFYIGGNDSMDTVAKLSACLRERDYEMAVLGLPKTIDNDLAGTDHTPGFGSAAKYIAVTMQEILLDCAVYRVPAVTVVELMGRDAGWLTAASALGRGVTGLEPDLVYLPERRFDPERFLADVRGALARHPNVVVAVSEGLRFADGRYVGQGCQSGARDVFGHAYLAGTGKVLEQLVRQEIGCKVRAVELNLPQRCAAHLASGTDLSEACGVGRAAVRAALEGVSGEMMTILRAGSSPYRAEFGHTDVAAVANRTRYVDDAYINAAGNHVTDACCAYLLPLIQGEPAVTYAGGLPAYLTLPPGGESRSR